MPRRLEGYTTFRSPSPFIVVPDSTVAMWWRSDAASYEASYEAPWNGPDTVQLLEMLAVTYRKGAPPTNAAPPHR